MNSVWRFLIGDGGGQTHPVSSTALKKKEKKRLTSPVFHLEYCETPLSRQKVVQGSLTKNYEEMGFSKSGCDLSSGLSCIFEALFNTIKGRLRGL